MVNSFRKLFSSKYGFIIKLLVSLLLLYVFFKTINFNSLNAIISSISYTSVFFLFLLTITRNLIGSLRFKVLSSGKVSIPFIVIVKQYFIASLFNNFLPTAIGGDAVRAFLISKYDTSKIEAGLLVLIERLLGFYSLIILSFISSLFWNVPKNIFYFIIFLVSFYTIFLIFFFKVKIRFLINKFKIFKNIDSLIEFYKKNLKILLFTFILSILYQVVSVYISYFVGKSIDLHSTFLPFLTFVPLVWFVTMIPISFGGIGLREFSFAYFLSLLNISKEKALIVSLGTYFALIINGLIGSIFYIIGNFSQKKDDKK